MREPLVAAQVKQRNLMLPLNSYLWSIQSKGCSLLSDNKKKFADIGQRAREQSHFSPGIITRDLSSCLVSYRTELQECIPMEYFLCISCEPKGRIGKKILWKLNPMKFLWQSSNPKGAKYLPLWKNYRRCRPPFAQLFPCIPCSKFFKSLPLPRSQSGS